MVVLVACGAFFLYMRDKNAKDSAKHISREYSRRIATAKKSPSAGLRHMGKALNQYRDDNGDYPPSLSELYPDYIPVKEYIDDIKWHYSPKAGDFILRKSVDGPGNKVLTASIGSDLQPAPASGKMLASSEKTNRSQIKPEAEAPANQSTERLILASVNPPSSIEKPLLSKPKFNLHQTADKPRDLQDDFENSKPEPPPLPSFRLSEKRGFVKRLKGSYLVWRNEDGSLGFGNIQYPLSEELTVFDGKEWVQIRRRRPQLAAIR